jgi:hypothetical protein
MSTENAAAGGELEAAPVVGMPNLDGGESHSVEEAFEAYQKRNTPAESAEAEPAPAEQESADEAGAAPEEGTTVEDQEGEPEFPAIDPPKSWSKEAHERWSKLDRETQEFLASRDSEDQKAIKRSLNEAAEARKAAEADQAKWKQERDQYAAKQSAYTQALETALQNEFGDIQTMNDVRKMQAEDPFRFQQWQLRQMELGQAKAEQQANEQRTAQEKHQKRATYETEQNKLLIEMVPEMADPKKSVEMRERAVAMLTDDLGLKMDQLTRWMQDDVGHEILSNAGIQKLIADQLKAKEVKAAPPKAIPKPVPAVQKPGVAPPKGQAAAESIQALTSKLNSSGSVEDAYALYQARQRRNASR